MPKYKADIFPHGGGNSHVAYVESDDQWSAESLLKLQYPDCDVRWLQKVSPAAASPDVADTTEGSLSLRDYALAMVLLAIGVPAYQWVKGTFFDNAQTEQVAADVLEAPPAEPASEYTTTPEPTRAEPGPVAGGEPVPEIARAQEESVVDATQVAEPVKLATFRVVVEAADGAEGELTVSARDEAHALQIVRDFRGNPTVIRVELP